MAEKAEIQLGDIVKDTISGFKGTVVCISDWIAGCRRITVAPHELKDGKPIDQQWFDEPMLKIVKPKNKPKKKKPTGGGGQESRSKTAF